MEQLRKLITDAMQYMEAASPRERRLINLALLGALAFVVLVSWSIFSRSISKHELALEEKRDSFGQVEKLAANYGAQEMQRQSLEQRLRQSPGQLMGYVENVTKQSQVEIGSMSDRGVVGGGQGGKPRESQVEANINKVPLDKLMTLLHSLESGPGVVRVRRLRLRKSYENKETLDVSLSVSAWQQ
jgi:general secretion pathway protein M